MDLSVDTINEVKAAFKTAFNTETSVDDRISANSFLEKVQESPNIAIPCGFHFAVKENEHYIRHLGIQLVENVIKYHWHDLSLQHKLCIKEHTMLLMKEGTLDNLNEPMHIKDKVSRIVVEIVKREWPQRWPTLLDELGQIAECGLIQTELVLLMFLRLSEDVAVLQNLESKKRRKDIYQSLNNIMPELFTFFMNMLDKHFLQYKQGYGLNDQVTVVQHQRVLEVVLITLTSYMEWISISHILSENGKVLQILCVLIEDENLKMKAAECLLQAVYRRLQTPDGEIVLFQSHFIVSLCRTARRAAEIHSEDNYKFIKVLVHALSALGCLLTSSLDKDKSFQIPVDFNLFLETLLQFSGHPSLQVFACTNEVWKGLFQENVLDRYRDAENIVIPWLTVAFNKVKKVGFPSRSDSLSCEFSCLDFDSDNQFFTFFTTSRNNTLNIVKSISIHFPDKVISLIEESFAEIFKHPVQSKTTFGNIFSQSHVEWDALSVISESILNQIHSLNYNISVQSVESLLCNCIEFKTNDPLVLSCILSCISNFFLFIEHVPNCLIKVIDYIFSILSMNLPVKETGEYRSKAVTNLRRHACAMLVRMAVLKPSVMKSNFMYLNTKIDDLFMSNIYLHSVEKIILREAQILISNNFCNYHQQSAYIAEVLTPIYDEWINLRPNFVSANSLLSFVGLDKEPCFEDSYAQERGQVIYIVNLITSIIKRSNVPSNINTAKEGSFFLGTNGDGRPITRNPASPHILPFLPVLFTLVRSYRALLSPAFQEQVGQGYQNVFDISDNEKKNILGFQDFSASDPLLEFAKVQTPQKRMQKFLNCHENWCQVIGQSAMHLGLEFFQFPQLLDYMVHSYFLNLELLKDHQIHHIVRFIIKPFIYNCPRKCQESILLPIIDLSFSFLIAHLSKRWDYILELKEKDVLITKEATDVQEIIEDIILNNLTKDCIELVKLLILPQKKRHFDEESPIDTNENEEKMEVTLNSVSEINALSSLGALCLQYASICQAVVTLLLQSLCCGTSILCLQCISLLGPLINWLVCYGQHYISAEAMKQVTYAIFKGLSVHGEHEQNQTVLLNFAVQCYEQFLPFSFFCLRELFVSLNQNNVEHLKKLEVLIAEEKTVKKEKMKKELMKNMLKPQGCSQNSKSVTPVQTTNFKATTARLCIIGHSLSENFCKELSIRDLPPIFRVSQPKQPQWDEVEENSGLCALFQQNRS